VAIRATRCPHHHHQPATKQSIGLEAWLAIILPVVQKRERGSGKHSFSVLKIQATLSQRQLSLPGIVRNSHRIYMPTENQFVKEFRHFSRLLTRQKWLYDGRAKVSVLPSWRKRAPSPAAMRPISVTATPAECAAARNTASLSAANVRTIS
jgi:hypothetical protein